MATLKTQVGSPGTRKEVGHLVLAAAKVADTKRVRARLSAFAKAHGAFVKAADKVAAAEAVRDAAHAAVALADVTQDAAVDALVLALVAGGAPRLAPLKGISTYSPSDLKGLATPKEAKELQRMTSAIAKRPGLTPALKKANKAAADASAAVLRSIVSVVPRERLYQESLASRDALSQPWETAMAYLKRAAKVADDDGAAGLFATLFQRNAEAPKKKKKAQPATG
ncbi:MAG: hypothetical protein JWM10_1844 [Myxococcaceae bacterium]|nr:hypothetical protein [Myxococcaceae bacterium]